MRALIKKENKPDCMEVGQVEKPSCLDDHVVIRVLTGGVRNGSPYPHGRMDLQQGSRGDGP